MQEVSSFCLGWLSSEDDDEWLTSSIQSEFMKDFYVEEVCMNGNVVSSYKVKNIIVNIVNISVQGQHGHIKFILQYEAKNRHCYSFEEITK